jgi:hypothetical protein
MTDKLAQGPMSDPVARGLCPTCGEEVNESDLTTEASRREAALSGMCQRCQDDFFGQEKTAQVTGGATKKKAHYGPLGHDCFDCGTMGPHGNRANDETPRYLCNDCGAGSCEGHAGECEDCGTGYCEWHDEDENRPKGITCGYCGSPDVEDTHDRMRPYDWDELVDRSKGFGWDERPDGSWGNVTARVGRVAQVEPVTCGQCGGQGGFPASTYDPSDPGWHSCYHCNETGFCTSDCPRCGNEGTTASKEIPPWIRGAALDFEVDASVACDDCGSQSDVSPWLGGLKMCTACRAAYEVSG